MPSMTTSGRALSFEVSPGAHVFGVGRDGLERNLRYVRVIFGFGIQIRSCVADRGVQHSNPSIEPRATAEPAEHGDRDCVRDRRAGLGPGMAEIEKRRAGLFQMLRLLDELLWRALVAMEFGEHRNSPLSHSVDKLGRS